MSEFSYQSEVDYKAISAEDDAQAVPLLDPFKKGILRPFEAHILNSDGLRKLLENPSLSSEIRGEFRLKSKNIDDELAAIVRAYSELEADLQTHQIEMTAQRDYYNFFTDREIDSSKLEFIVFLKTYEYLSTFNKRVFEAWDYIRETFEDIKVTSVTRQFLEQVLSFKVYPRLELCDLGDLLLRRIAYILQIKSKSTEQDKVVARGEYSSLIRYTFPVIFREDLDTVLGGAQSGEDSVVKPQKLPDAASSRETCISDPYFLDSRGQELFNQGYVYTLKIQEERKRVEEQKIRRCVYVETHLGAEESALRQDLIRKFISAARNKDRITEYNRFLNEYFAFARDAILLQFSDFSEQEKTLMMYHLGPLYFLKITLYFMREGRTGFIHLHLKKDQMIRELPLEYLKFIFKDWWEESIFTRLSRTERNSRELYDRLVAAVRDIWVREAPQAISSIKANPVLLRAFKIHDVRSLGRFLEQYLTLIIYSLLKRFLGPDFVYLQAQNDKGAKPL